MLIVKSILWRVIIIITSWILFNKLKNKKGFIFVIILNAVNTMLHYLFEVTWRELVMKWDFTKRWLESPNWEIVCLVANISIVVLAGITAFYLMYKIISWRL